MSKRIKIGISACLMGQKVRYDGGSFQPKLIHSVLPDYMDFVPFCPEVEIGMSVPRETVRLVTTETGIKLKAPKSGTDYTNQMNAYSIEKTNALSKLEISGYILKKGSPTCGMERVRVYNSRGIPEKSGNGLFASQLKKAFPNIPIEEDGRLNDIHLREHWIERVFAYDRLRTFLSLKPAVGKLMEFHTQSKMQLMAHHPEKYRLLGRKIALLQKDDLHQFYASYLTSFMQIMSVKPTIAKHTDVIYHLVGFFKKKITASDKKEILNLIEQFRNQIVPIVVPLTLLKHFLQKYPVKWMQEQTYLNPYPTDLSLRSHI